jgi:hypothetical protein
MSIDYRERKDKMLQELQDSAALLHAAVVSDPSYEMEIIVAWRDVVISYGLWKDAMYEWHQAGDPA